MLDYEQELAILWNVEGLVMLQHVEGLAMLWYVEGLAMLDHQQQRIHAYNVLIKTDNQIQ